MFKLQSPSKHSPLDAVHLLRLFSTAQNSSWNYRFWCSLVFLPFFVSPHLYQQNISLWGRFSSQETKEVSLGEIRWIGRMGKGGMLILVKNCWTLSATWAGALVNHPSRNGQMCWKSLKKKIHWSQIQPLTTPPAGALIQMGSRNTHLAG